MQTETVRSAHDAQGYRADIDGLRAIAVLLVIIYHFGVVSISGGFVGVDVFFVISGFVITRSIDAGLARGDRFSYLEFLARRMLRLAPATALVTLAVMAIGWFVLPTRDYIDVGRSAAASVFFVANIFFARRTGYFAPDAGGQPLLHMWSLGVEEQFYLAAPLLIAGLAYRPLGRRLAWVVVFVVSLGLAGRAGLRADADVYFLLQFRAFELAIGVLLAIGIVRLPNWRWLSEVAALTGIALIVASALVITSEMMFPAPWALAPCIGTALVILAGESRKTLTSRFLSLPPMVFVGAVSFALYLWHWPLIVFAKMLLGRDLDLLEGLALAALTLLLAVATHYALERPLRAKAGVPVRGARVAGVAVAAACVAAFGGIASINGLPGRLSPAVVAHEKTMTALNAKASLCDLDTACLLGAPDAPVTFVVWGDSHAFSLALEFETIARLNGVRLALIAGGGCPPLMSGTTLDNPRRQVRCTRANALLVQTLDAHASIKRVVLHARWMTYTERDHRRRSAQLVTGDAERSSGVLADTLSEAVTYLLQQRRLAVTLVGPVPEPRGNPLPTQLRALMRTGDLPNDSALGVPVQEFSQRNAFALGLLAKLASQQQVQVALPHEVLCPEPAVPGSAVAGQAICRAVKDRTPLYYDNNHLNAFGAEQLRALLTRAAGLRAVAE
jgi:peptidoglycan/LPS O-acetylase OafA/YrhL